MTIFLDYDGVVNTIIWDKHPKTGELVANYGQPRDNKVNNYQAVQWLSELCEKFDADIVVTSTWRYWDNYEECLKNGGLREGIAVVGKTIVDDNSRASQINSYLLEHLSEGNEFIILDDEIVDMSPFGYDKDAHFVQCKTNGGFQYEEYHEAKRKIEQILGIADNR